MIGQSRILMTLRAGIAKSPADETEAVCIATNSATTRYANSRIHQNMAESNIAIIFRAVRDGKVGVASTNSLTKENMAAALKNACAIAEHSVRNPDFRGLPGPARYKKIKTFFEDTAAYSPKQRAEVIREICRKADKLGLTVAGAFTTSSTELAVVNSKGIACYQPLTTAWINLIAMSDTSSGYAEGLSRNVLKIPFGVITETAFRKCIDGRNPSELPPGRYDVILEPVAVSSIMDWLSYIGFGAKPFLEKTSFMSGKVGRRVMSPEITILDDGTNPAGLAVPFDFEGVPKRPVFLIKKGVAVGPVYDTLYATRAKTRSTGHALLPGSGEGPMAGNLFIAPGQRSRESLIASVKDGVLVTRFFYINGLLFTPKAVMTGMTRDGTFRIKNGKIVGAVKNLRFTESIVAAFSRVGGVSRETQLVRNWWDEVGSCCAPSIMIRKFNFSGKTEF